MLRQRIAKQDKIKQNLAQTFAMVAKLAQSTQSQSIAHNHQNRPKSLTSSANKLPRLDESDCYGNNMEEYSSATTSLNENNEGDSESVTPKNQSMMASQEVAPAKEKRPAILHRRSSKFSKTVDGRKFCSLARERKSRPLLEDKVKERNFAKVFQIHINFAKRFFSYFFHYWI